MGYSCQDCGKLGFKDDTGLQRHQATCQVQQKRSRAVYKRAMQASVRKHARVEIAEENQPQPAPVSAGYSSNWAALTSGSLLRFGNL